MGKRLALQGLDTSDTEYYENGVKRVSKAIRNNGLMEELKRGSMAYREKSSQLADIS